MRSFTKATATLSFSDFEMWKATSQTTPISKLSTINEDPNTKTQKKGMLSGASLPSARATTPMSSVSVPWMSNVFMALVTQLNFSSPMAVDSVICFIKMPKQNKRTRSEHNVKKTDLVAA